MGRYDPKRKPHEGPVTDGTESGEILNDFHSRMQRGETIPEDELRNMTLHVLLLEKLGR